MLVAEAYRLKFTFADAPNHLQSGERWPGISFEEWPPKTSLLTAWREKLCSMRKCEHVTRLHMTHASPPYILQIVILRSCTEYYINKLYIYKLLTTKGDPLYIISLIVLSSFAWYIFKILQMWITEDNELLLIYVAQLCLRSCELKK
jgi:hypothetical protein